MTHDEIDLLWFRATDESVRAGEIYTRHRFAAMVAAAEREACAQVCDEWSKRSDDVGAYCAKAIRARSINEQAQDAG